MFLRRPCSPMLSSSRFVTLILIGLICAACNTGDNKTGGIAGERNQPPEPTSPTQTSSDAVALPIVDTTYSDAPECNALLHRIAEEVLPCLQRVSPEIGQRLETALAAARTSPRLKGEQAGRKDVQMRVEEACREHWSQMMHQLDSKAPEGECLLKDPP
jgi:hypothetical protein